MPSRIVDRFARVRAAQPDKTLVIGATEGRSLTCDGLWQESALIAETLSRAGLGPGSLVVSAAGNRVAALPLLLACWQRDVAVLPADRSTPRLEMRALVHQWSPSAIVVQDDGPLSGAEWGRSVVGEALLPSGLRLHRFRQDPAVETVRGCLLLKLTSGSTGLPKATRTTESNLWHEGWRIVEAMSIRPSDVQLGVIPLSHAYGMGNLVLPLLLQGTTVVLRESFVPATLASDVAAFGVDVFPGVPFMFDHLATALPSAALRRLRTTMTAGARIDDRTVVAFHDRFGLKIHSFYGTSETGGISYDDTDGVETPVSVGKPMGGTTVTCVAVDGVEAPAGRVFVTSPTVADGYAGPGAVQEGFVDGGFLTGDLGELDARGHLRLTGRVSSFVNVAGKKVLPDEVERVLREMPALRDVRVLGAPCPRRGEVLVACVVGAGPSVSMLDVRQFCAARLAPHKVPRELLLLDAIPIDERGKTDRRRLDALVAARMGSS